MTRHQTAFALCLFVLGGAAFASAGETDTIAGLSRHFADPPVEYRIQMLLRTNDDVSEEELRWQIRSMREQGCGGAFSYAERFQGGAPERFLSDWWWTVVRWTADACAKEGLLYWTYDEEDWPTGAAGGLLLEKHPEFRWQYLKAVERPVEGGASVSLDVGTGTLVAALAFQIDGSKVRMESVRDLATAVKDGQLTWQAPTGSWTVAIYTAIRENVGWQNRGYMDTMDPKACATFVDWVYRGHAEQVAKVPGAKLTGFFLDEPSMTLAAYPGVPQFTWWPAMPYSGLVPETFRKLYGGDWHTKLPLLYHEGGPETVRFRCQHWDVCCRLYTEHFFGSIYRFCEERGMKSSGHLHVEEDHKAHLTLQGGNMLAHFRNMHIPGIDWIHPYEHTIPSTTPKYAVSMAHLMGRERAWCESFAACGWGVPLQEIRRQVDWEHVNGISMQIPISYKYSVRGANRATFYNPGVGYQQPWWDHFRPMGDYEGRMCLLTSGGGHVAQIALAYPEVDMRAHCRELDLVHKRGLDYNAFGDALRFAGYDYDVLDDEAILDHARVADGTLRTKTESFPVLIFSPIDAARRATLQRALELARSGGTVLFIGTVPTHSLESGGNDPEVTRLITQLLGNPCSQPADRAGRWVQHGKGRAGFAATSAEAITLLREAVRPDLLLPDGVKDLCAYHRALPDGHVYLVLNRTSKARTAEVTLGAKGHPERWNGFTGAVEALPRYEIEEKGTRLTIDFDPDELVALILRPDKPHVAPPARPTTVVREVPIPGPFRFRAEDTLARPHLAWNFSQEKDGWKLATRPAIPGQMSAGDWAAQGIPHFSGIGHYQTRITLDAPAAGERVFLDLGRVATSAQVRVNGQRAGITVVEPYRVEITRQVRAGENNVEIAVANTLANYYAQFKELEKAPISLGGIRPGSTVSGLLGPVRVVFMR